ncbi:MAG: serine/threonine protein kinase, partial [Actinobacteria bacterium]|nr:serine/threonine protein kinase [Actinomycetota bacterium]
MSARRAPMAAPDLPGFTYVDLLGSGGFADVYLYEQHLPRRRVAVKVLLTERISSGSVSEFTAEANVMAMLSTHPAIVTIYQAGVAGDGRPYLVMEYCPKPNLQVRYRREPFPVAESLRVGVQVAAAVETAHRAGVLHRDIKPANILVTDYNRPALTDFGIASTTSAAAESAGLSIPWSPPESFADVPRSDPRSDVYALGATVYTLLAGRSPFEWPGQRNTAADLIQRIEGSPLPVLTRPDAPASLTHVLERATAKSPADRYQTAVDFARALQKVQIELSHAVTAIDILDDGAPEDVVDDEDDGLTRVRGVVSIDPETAPAAGATRRSASFAPPAATPSGYVAPPAAYPATPPSYAATYPDAADAAFDTVVRGAVSPPVITEDPRHTTTDVGQTVRRGVFDASAADADTDAAGAPVDTSAPRSRRGLWAAVAAGAFLVVLAVVLVVSLPAMLAGGVTPSPSASATAKPVDILPVSVPSPTDLVGTPTAAGVVFTWANPDPQQGDTYLWAVVTGAGDGAVTRATEPTVTVPADASGRTCLSVLTRRSDG